MSLRTTLIVAIAWACVSLAQAADQPTDGFLYNTGGSSGLRYSCNTLRFDEIVCEFTQTSLRRRADPKDLQKELQNAKAQFASVKLPSGDACSGYKKLLNTLKTGDTSGMPDPAEASQKFKVSRGQAPAHPSWEDRDANRRLQKRPAIVSGHVGRRKESVNGNCLRSGFVLPSSL
jgi:hypothetical protein